MKLNDLVDLPDNPSPTSKLINTLQRLLQIAIENGVAQSDLVLAHIGDVKGIEALDVMSKSRVDVADKMMRSRVNLNGYPPYPGMPELRKLVAVDLLRRLGTTQDEGKLRECGVLEEAQGLGDLVHIASGSVCCSGSIYAHIRYLKERTGRAETNVAMDTCHYWKHQGVGADAGKVKVYGFMRLEETEGEAKLVLDASAVAEFGLDGGGVLMVNFGNPCNFLPTGEESQRFAKTIVDWNEQHPESLISVVIDSPYDDFDYEDNRGYFFASALLTAGVTTSYCHARTKEEFATGSRLGEVLSNHPFVRAAFTDYKADYIGSDSRLEQEIAILMHQSQEARDEQKRDRMNRVRERKRYFWAELSAHHSLKEVITDTKPFYREEGAFYLFLNVRSLILAQGMPTSLQLCEHLASKGIILVPGVLFDLNPDLPQGFNQVCVRVSFAAFAEDRWKEEIDKLVSVLASLSAR